MLKLSEELDIMFRVNQFLKSGLRGRLFNLRALARFLRPQLEKRLQKNLTEGSIHVALSRLQARSNEAVLPVNLEPELIRPNLYLARFANHPKQRVKILNWVNWVRKQRGKVWVQEHSREITLVLSQGFLEEMSQQLEVKPVEVVTQLTGYHYEREFQQIFQELWLSEKPPLFVSLSGEELFVLKGALK